MKKIFITRKLLRSCEDKAKEIFDTNLNLNDEMHSQEKLIELSEGFDGILSSLTDKLDAETINKLPKTIKIISNFAVGFGNIDLEAAKNRGIVVTNTPDVLTDATAEIGVLLILGACRRASEGIDSARQGGWKWSADYLIGKQGATYHNNLKDLLSVSDVLSICCPASKDTIDMINKETIEYLPKGAVITNVARGDIIDDDALIDALDRRKIYAVGLDVYKNEPNLNPGYLKHKSAFILPHLGSATKETRTAMANLAIDNIDEFFNTGNCKNKVN